MDDRLISLNAAIDAICEDGTRIERQGRYSMTMVERKQRDVDILVNLPSVQPSVSKTEIVGDVISRQAAIKTLKSAKTVDPSIVGCASNAGVDWCIDVIKALPPAQPGWIPVTERLPDVRQWVLCQCRAGIMDVLRLTADGSWNKNYPHTEYMSGFVVAWMPLPDPWKGGQDG